MNIIKNLINRNKKYLVSISVQKGKNNGFMQFTVDTKLKLNNYNNINEMITELKNKESLDTIVILNIVKLKG